MLMTSVDNALTDRDTDISFILPVYNVEKFLCDCIESIVFQVPEEFRYEIICIDDHSIDGSYELLKELQNKYNFIIIKRNECNKGVSYSRNLGLKQAKGKYIWFVDPDDIVAFGAVEIFLKIAYEQCADVVIANYKKIKEEYKNEFKAITGHNEIKKVNTLDYCWLPGKDGESKMFSLWRGIFLKDFLIQNDLFLNEKVIIMEDSLFYYELQQLEPKIIKCEFPCYMVRQRSGSAMRSSNNIATNKIQYESLLELYKTYVSFMDENKYRDINELKKRINSSRNSIIVKLALIKDFSYVKKNLNNLIRMKIFPFKGLTGVTRIKKLFLQTKIGFYFLCFINYFK